VDKDSIVEIGYILYDTDNSNYTNFYSTLVWGKDYVYPKEVQEINGISEALCKKKGVSPVEIFNHMNQVFQECDVVVAHNGLNFDRPLLYNRMSELRFFPIKRPWIDTRLDIEYDSKYTSKRLGHLAIDHGIINPMPHRAVFDAYASLMLLLKYDVRSLAVNATYPLIKIGVSPCYADNERVRNLRYFWDRDAKMWCKYIRQNSLEKELGLVQLDHKVLETGDEI